MRKSVTFSCSIPNANNTAAPVTCSTGIFCIPITVSFLSFLAEALKEFKHPRLAGYDLNSRFELEPGKKDPVRILTFLNELK